MHTYSTVPLPLAELKIVGTPRRIRNASAPTVPVEARAPQRKGIEFEVVGRMRIVVITLPVVRRFDKLRGWSSKASPPVTVPSFRRINSLLRLLLLLFQDDDLRKD